MGTLGTAILHRQQEQLIAALRSAGACSASTAVPIDLLHTDRDAVARLVRHGVVLVTQRDRIFLSGTGLADYLQGQRRTLSRVTVGLLLAVVVALVLLAIRHAA